jgi:Flp pilus assembly protein TadG
MNRRFRENHRGNAAVTAIAAVFIIVIAVAAYNAYRDNLKSTAADVIRQAGEVAQRYPRSSAAIQGSIQDLRNAVAADDRKRIETSTANLNNLLNAVRQQGDQRPAVSASPSPQGGCFDRNGPIPNCNESPASRPAALPLGR